MPRYPSRRPAESSAEAGGVTAVDRALALLLAFREGDSTLSLGELVGRSQLVRSTALRLLASLQHFGLIRRLEDGRYVLGATISRLHAVYAATFSLEAEVMPVLRTLVRKTNEGAIFNVRQGDERVVLHHVRSTQSIQHHVEIGELAPLERGAGGRVLMAFSGAKGAIYDRIRRDKVAALVGDRQADLAGIAAPVFRAGQELVGAITLTMPANRYKQSHIVPVVEAARTLTARLGGTF